MYSDISPSSRVTARGIMSSTRSSMNGIISPQCPMITRSPGCRAKAPEAARRGRRRGGQVQRHVERLEPGQQHGEGRVVEEPLVDAKSAVDQPAHEPEAGYAPRE